jgi:hypothetical protein
VTRRATVSFSARIVVYVFRYILHFYEDNIKMDLQQVGWGGMDWVTLAEDWNRWRAVAYAVMNLGFNKMRAISWLAEDLLASQEGLCSTQSVSYMYWTVMFVKCVVPCRGYSILATHRAHVFLDYWNTGIADSNPT